MSTPEDRWRLMREQEERRARYETRRDRDRRHGALLRFLAITGATLAVMVALLLVAIR